MVSAPIELPAAQRAQWLAELAEALERAQTALVNLSAGGKTGAELLELHLRIEAARLEVQSLRLSRSLHPRGDSDPEWTRLSCPLGKPFD